MKEWLFVVIVAIVILALLVRQSLRMEKVGELLVPTDFGFFGMTLRLVVRRESGAADEAIILFGMSGTGGAGLRELSPREAQQVATWLEAAGERSDGSFGSVDVIEVASSYDGKAYSVELIQHSGDATTVGRLSAEQARTVAGWLRVAAAPGRTLADARRRSRKVPA